uniref:Peptide deformylase n=1 Tax=Panstrongylus megistus TaxID=65343 RepID=A0A069DQT1_9HEMI
MNLRLFKILYQNWWRGTPPIAPYKHIVQIGDPVLRQKSRDVDPTKLNDAFIQQLFSRLYVLMKKSNAAGIAAPQIGVSLRVFAVQFPIKKKFHSPVMYDQRDMEPIPLQVWVNPVMKVLDYEKIVFDECCESMKGYTANTPRYKKVLLTGLDHNGKEKSWEAKGWSARIIQHEMDHLDGKFFTDIMDPKSLTCTVWDVVNRTEGRIYTTYMVNK